MQDQGQASMWLSQTQSQRTVDLWVRSQTTSFSSTNAMVWKKGMFLDLPALITQSCSHTVQWWYRADCYEMTVQCLWFSLWILLSRLLAWPKLLTEWKHMSHCYLPGSIDNGTPCLANVLLKKLLANDFSQIYDFCENIVMENSFFKRKLFFSLDYNKQEGTGQRGKFNIYCFS